MLHSPFATLHFLPGRQCKSGRRRCAGAHRPAAWNEGNGLWLLGKVSEQSGYLFIYDSKVIHNDSVVRVRKQECSVRQAIHRITGSRNLELKVLGKYLYK